MVESINPIEKITSTTGFKSGEGQTPNPPRVRQDADSDQVSFNSDSLVDSVRSGIAQLERDLPGQINNAILAPLNSENIRQEPLNSLLFRLEDPLTTILQNAPEVSDELIVKIQEELETFKLSLSNLKAQGALSQLTGASQLSDLDRILNSLAGEVDHLIGGLGAR